MIHQAIQTQRRETDLLTHLEALLLTQFIAQTIQHFSSFLSPLVSIWKMFDLRMSNLSNHEVFYIS